MYESHFGLSAPPFQLNPDPAFYFDSRGHSSALAYLKFGVHQGEGFIVVTGEIGAGKTTLVRTLLQELDPDKVVAAQIVSTQLEAGDLLRSVVMAFGISSKSLTKADLIATIESFLTLLAAKNKRALLIVDEAQNLSREAVEELRMLSNFQLGNQALLQSFLVGQPELRTILTSKSMEQFRQRVIASCHLGPMDRAETRAYIEHRLQRVGWQGNNPAFDDAAHEELYRWTGGVPRRINILCNRVLLAAYLSGSTAVDAALVRQTAQDLRSEIGESVVAPVAFEASASATAAPDSGYGAFDASVQRPLPPAVGDPGPVLCVASGRQSYIKMIPVLRALAMRRDLPSPLLVQVGRVSQLNPGGVPVPESVLPNAAITIAVEPASLAVQTAEVMKRFDAMAEHYRPSAIVVVGGSDAALACALVASRRGVPLVSVDAGVRSFDRATVDEVNRALTDQLADVLFISNRNAQHTLAREGVAADRLQFVGNVLVDALRLFAPYAPLAPDTLKRAGVPVEIVHGRNGFGVVVMNHPMNTDVRSALSDALAHLKQVSQGCPLVWPAAPAIRAKIDAFGLMPLLDDARVCFVPQMGYLEMVGLLRGASCVLTDSGQVREDAAALGVQCLSIGVGAAPALMEQTSFGEPLGSSTHVMNALDDFFKTGRGQGMTPEMWDGRAAERVAQYLAQWLRQRGVSIERVSGETFA